jgi:tRNA(Arg) A34 adenosine deaminase TadA
MNDASVIKSNMEVACVASLNNVLNRTGGPFGAVVVDTKTQSIVACSSNSVTTQNDPTAHAEVNAIRAACKKLNKFDLSGHSMYTSCEPCPMCFGAIYWARLDHVYYANTKTDAARIDFDDSLIYAELEKSIEDRKIKFTHMPNRIAEQAFELWEAGDDKVKY